MIAYINIKSKFSLRYFGIENLIKRGEKKRKIRGKKDKERGRWSMYVNIANLPIDNGTSI